MLCSEMKLTPLMLPLESILGPLREKRNSMRQTVPKYFCLVLEHRTPSNHDVRDCDLPSFVLEREFQFFYKLVAGVYGWEQFILVMRAHERTMVELNAFLFWAQDVESYPKRGCDHRVCSLRGSIFSTVDSDIFLAFAHMTAPVYLTSPEIPHSDPPFLKLDWSPWRNKVAVESIATSGKAWCLLSSCSY